MPRLIERKSETTYRTAKPKAKAYKIYDGDGLLMVVRPNGRKVWQYHFTFKGKRTNRTLGYYQPERPIIHTNLSKARTARDKMKLDMLSAEELPSQSQSNTENITFKNLGDEWLYKQLWVDGHKKRVQSLLQNVVYPKIGNKQLHEISGRDIVDLIQSKEKEGTLSVAKAIAQRCSSIFEYGIWKNVCQDNPALRKGDQIKLPKAKCRPHLLESQIPDFLRALEKYKGREFIKLGLKLNLLTFTRPSELRCAKWQEFDLDSAQWFIPAERMKMDRNHIVPLSSQAIVILKQLKEITRNSEYLFPSIHSAFKPISDVTFLKALQIMGYTGEKKIVPHGFRHTATTILNNYGFNRDHIERQMAHIEENKIRGVYNHAEYLEDRKTMMQWYADHIYKLGEK